MFIIQWTDAMRPFTILASAAILALTPRLARAQMVEVRSAVVQVRGDSLGRDMVQPSQLRLPSQRPWQNEFFVLVTLSPLDPKATTNVDVSVGFDVKMGPQRYNTPDGEVVLREVADSLGVWFRAERFETQRLDCAARCAHEVQFGPFPLADLIPGPHGPDAVLWPTRLRVAVQAFATRGVQGTTPGSPRRSQLNKEIPIR